MKIEVRYSKRAGIVEALLQNREFRIITLKFDTEICHRKAFLCLFGLAGYDKTAFMLLEYIFCLVLHAF